MGGVYIVGENGHELNTLYPLIALRRVLFKQI